LNSSLEQQQLETLMPMCVLDEREEVSDRIK